MFRCLCLFTSSVDLLQVEAPVAVQAQICTIFCIYCLCIWCGFVSTHFELDSKPVSCRNTLPKSPFPIMSARSMLLTLALAAQSILGAPAPTSDHSALQSRAIINHDAVVGFAETVPATTAGSLMLKYKPLLKVFNGCVPFPAVDASGNTGYAL